MSPEVDATKRSLMLWWMDIGSVRHANRMIKGRWPDAARAALLPEGRVSMFIGVHAALKKGAGVCGCNFGGTARAISKFASKFYNLTHTWAYEMKDPLVATNTRA